MSGVPLRGWIFRLVRLILGHFVSRVRTLKADYKELEQLQAQGQLIFVSQAASLIDLMILNAQLERHQLKPLRFTHGVNPFFIYPFFEAFSIWRRRLFRSHKENEAEELEMVIKQLEQGGNGLIFLKKGHRFESRIDYFNGYFGRIATHFEASGRNIYLVPTSIFLTRMRKTGTRRTYLEIFFGTYDIPGRVRKLYQLLVNYQKGGTIFSKHIDLSVEREKHSDLREDKVEKRLRWTLLFHLNNEDRAYRGPTKRSKARKVRKILAEKQLNEELKTIAESSGRPLEQVLKEANKNLNEIASDTSERVINLMRMLFDYVWSRTLEGIDVRQEDLDRIRELSKGGPVVYLPCHRSHVDYLSVAYLFETQGLNYPRIAAGDNLAKWPLGPVLRRCGAFFLRRSFKGEAIFPLVFDAYLRHVLRERHVLLFFPEGGRSRTGKLLHPKMGMLAMLLDAWRQNVVKDLPLVPVTIDYGKVFEGGAYLREKSGLPKQKENLASVLRSRKVLRHKHGVMRMRFGEPIYLADYVEKAGHSRENLGFKVRLPLLNDLSYEVLNRINQRVTLTAGNVVAGLLLGTPRRGMTQKRLKTLFVITVRYLASLKVELAFTEKRLDLALENALASFEESETLVRVTVGGETVVNVPDHKRAELEYYKNNGLHFVLETSLFCLAYTLLEPAQRTMTEIGKLAREIFSFIRYEFLIQGDFPTDEQMEAAYRAMERIDAMRRTDEGKVYSGEFAAGADLRAINAYMLVNLIESYFVVCEVLCELDGETALDAKQLLKQCMVKAKLLYAVGTLSRQESINHISFDNALTSFNREGFVRSRAPKGGKAPLISVNPTKREAFLALKARAYHWLQQLV